MLVMLSDNAVSESTVTCCNEIRTAVARDSVGKLQYLCALARQLKV